MRQKGMVMEAQDNWALLLMPNGTFRRIRTRQRLFQGQLYSPVQHSVYKPVAAAFLLAVLLFSWSFFPVVAYARLSTGVELGVNRYGRIVSSRVYNPGGEKLTTGLRIWGQSIDKVLPVLLHRSVEQIHDEAGQEVGVELKAANPGVKQDEKVVAAMDRVLNRHKAEDSGGKWQFKQEKNSWQWENDQNQQVKSENTQKSVTQGSGSYHKEKVEETGSANRPLSSSPGNSGAQDNNSGRKQSFERDRGASDFNAKDQDGPHGNTKQGRGQNHQSIKSGEED